MPTISIVICSFNREKFILDALKSLLNQTIYHNLFEVIIVNNNSTDNTHQLCQNFLNEYKPTNFRYVIEYKKGLSAARNCGINESNSEWITFIDDDAIAPNNFVNEIVLFINNNKDCAGFGGKVIPKYEIEEPKWMNKFLSGHVTSIDYKDKVFLFSNNNYPVGCNMTYRKDLLIKCGLFNEALHNRADEKYIYFEIKKLNKLVYYVPTILVYHQIDSYRTEDKNFIKLSLEFGSEEGIRVRNKGHIAFVLKVMEYLYKLVASVLIRLFFIIKGQNIKGLYTFKYRLYALKGLLSSY